jgi:U3 small nucleolar RNA-associated protein 3
LRGQAGFIIIFLSQTLVLHKPLNLSAMKQKKSRAGGATSSRLGRAAFRAPKRARATADDDDVLGYDAAERHAGLHMIDGAGAGDDAGADDDEGVYPVLGLGAVDDAADGDDDDDYGEDDECDAGAADDAADAAASQRERISREDRILTAWGRDKKAFYEADADVEIDEEAAAAEEAEARRLQSRRAAALEDDDVGFGSVVAGRRPSAGAGAGAGAGETTAAAVERVSRDVSALSRSAKLDIVLADAPELVALLDEARAAVAEVRGVLVPLLEAARDGRIAVGASGLSFLEVKLSLWLAYVTDVTFYLLLKAEGRSVKDHPVIAQLVHIRALCVCGGDPPSPPPHPARAPSAHSRAALTPTAPPFPSLTRSLERLRPLDAKLQFQIARLLRAAATKAPPRDAAADSAADAATDSAADAATNSAAVDYSDIAGHSVARAARAATQSARRAVADGDDAARPNRAALLVHGDAAFAVDAARRGAGRAADGGRSVAGGARGKGRSGSGSGGVVVGGGGDDGDGGDGGGGGGGRDGAPAREAFVPLRRTAVPYTGDGAAGKAARTAERARSRLSRSRLLAELKSAYSDAPEEATVDGVGAPARSRADAAAAETRERERAAHEEETFSRLATTRADKAARRARERDGARWDSLADELEHFGDFEADTRAVAGGDADGDGRAARTPSAAPPARGTALERVEADARARARLAAAVNDAAETGMAARVGRKRTASAAAAALRLDGDGDGDGDGGDGDAADGGAAAQDPFLAEAAAAAAARRAARGAARDADAAARAAFYRARPAGDDAPASGHRKASRQIIDNRGLVKYRKKEAANPRVAYRIKAEKKLKRRVGAVPNMRDGGAEADNYKGETTGIRAAISKSRQIRN